MASNAMTTALALPSSKTNWTAIVPARAPPPPPPVTQATMLKRTHEIQCGKCAISDYAENIGVWNDDGTLQELGLCGECEEDDGARCDICCGCGKFTETGNVCECGGGHRELCDDCKVEKPDIVGCCECCECDVTTDQDYLKLKTGPGAGRIYCEEHVGWGECQKAWSGSCGCDVCADEEEEDEQTCDGCGTTCLDHTSNKGRGSESPCEECGETRCKFCPCECEEATTEFARNKICDECGCKGGCELTCVYVCGEDEEKDIVGCCEKCDMEIVRDSDEHDNCLIGADDKFYCQHCPAAMCEMCEVCYTNGGSISVLGRDISICENCDKGGDCYDGFLDEYHYNAETNDYEEKKEEDSDEVKQYKAVLAETLRYEAIMDMMKK